MTSPSPLPTSQIARLVLAANRAPSAENCQPWSFHWDGQTLAITHDTVRARHVLNHHEDVSRIALGCVLEALAIAARDEGLRVEEQHLSQHAPSAPWASVRFVPEGERGHPLAHAIVDRCTDRRLFRGGSIKAPVFADLARDAARFSTVGLHAIDRRSEALTGFITAADATIWRDAQAYRDVTRWVRFSTRELDATGDGVPWNSAGFRLPASPLFRLSRLPLSRTIAERVGLLTMARLWVEQQLASSAALVCITVRAPSREALVDAGRLGFSMWLRLNHAGFAVHPMTIQSLPIYHAATTGLREGTAPDHVALFREGRGIVARAFGYADDALPVWMFRTGLAPPAPLRESTRRLPLDRIFTYDEHLP